MTRSLPALVALALLPVPAAAADPPAAADGLFARDNLVAWCVVPFDAKKRSPEDRAAMLRRLGFTHYAYDWRAEHLPTFEREIAALKKNGVELTAVWFPGGLNADARLLLDALKKHGLKTQLWVMLGDPPGPDQAAKVTAAAGQLAPVARAAAAIGCAVGLYNHGGWSGEPENQLAVLAALQLPNVGLVYNLHHGHDHLARFPDLMKAMRPHLLCVNLNGMAKDGDKHGKKILPLGQGDRDLDLLRTVRDSGYRGRVGIIGHTQDDAEERLRDNLDGLDWLRPQLAGAKPGPRPTPRTTAARPWEPRLTADGAVEVTLSTDAELGWLRTAPDAELRTVLAVTVGDGPTPIPGGYRVAGNALRFTPRFPLTPGVAYQATFDPNAVPVHPDIRLRTVAATLTVPKPERKPTTVVAQVYPTADRLPENTLRLYVRFSAPMARGGAYRHLTLLTAAGREVASPFLELDEELWSADGTRLTVLFDPGRIKRGLRPREDLGPVLEEGQAYTLAVDAAWEDETGAPLTAGFRKAFTAGPPDDAPVDPARWTVLPPDTAARPVTPLRVQFEKPLDHALAARMVWVVGPDGARVDVPAQARADGRGVAFGRGGAAWPPGSYKLVVDTRLEDPCGNRVGRPFEVDVFRPVSKAVEAATAERAFEVR